MPSEGELEICLSDGFHLTRSSKRFERLPVDPESIDVVFTENARHNPPPKSAILKNWIAVPFLLLPLYMYLYLLNLAGSLGLTDKGVVDMMEQHGAEVITTDRNFHRLISSQRIGWGIGHWAIILVAFMGSIQWIENTRPISFLIFTGASGTIPSRFDVLLAYFVLAGVGLIWFLIAGCFIAFLFIVGTIESRNHKMVNDIEQIACENQGYCRGCLVIGGKHASHIEQLIKISPNLELIVK